MPVSVESSDQFDISTLSIDCAEEKLRTIEVSLYPELHRTTADEPPITMQQTQGRKGFEAWHTIVRRDDQRNMCDTNSVYAALISNTSERDRAKDVGQFDDILKTFVKETKKFENAFGKIRDEEKRCSQSKS